MSLTVNGRHYLASRIPTAVIVLSGVSRPALDDGMRSGRLPHLAAMCKKGTSALVTGIMPSLRMPNICSIISGVASDQHGVWRDPTDEKVPVHLRVDSILQKLSAHEKVFAAATDARITTAMLPTCPQHTFVPPGTVEPERSLACVNAAAASLLEGRCTVALAYTNDALLHRHAESHAHVQEYYAGFDAIIGKLTAAGVRVGVTGDFTLTQKTGYSGKTRGIDLRQILAAHGFANARVQYVTSRACQAGGFAVVEAVERADEVAAILRRTPGCHAVVRRDFALPAYQFPSENTSFSLVVSADPDSVFVADADLPRITHTHFHGSAEETNVPMLLSTRTGGEAGRALGRGKMRNYDIFTLLRGGLPEGAAVPW